MEELIKEGQEFVKKRDITYKDPEKKSPTLKPNTRFLRNVIIGNMFSNKHRNRRRAEAALISSKTQENKETKRLKTS